MVLTPAQAAFYRENGYVVVENLISPADLRLLSQRLDQIQEDAREARSGAKPFDVTTEPAVATAAKPAVRKLAGLANHDPLFRRIAETPALLDVVTELTGGGEHIMLHSDQAFLKPAFCGSEKPVHQDNSYFKITPDIAGITCWMAVDDATLDNGCMRYIPGSHKLGEVKHKRIEGTPHLIPDGVDLADEVPVPIAAGTCIFHHLSVMHASRANTSAKSRRSWSMHYANRSVAETSNKPWEQMLALR